MLDAVEQNNIKLIRALLKYGARTDVCSRENKTVFDLLPQDEIDREEILAILRSS